MRDTVAKLDTAPATWVLYLDSDSPAEDLWWAMLSVLDLLVVGRDPENGRGRRLRLVEDRTYSPSM